MASVSLPRGGARRALVACLAVVLVVFGATLTFGFVNWDDDLHVYRNPLVLEGAQASSGDLLLTPRLGYPAPFAVLTYRIEHALVGLTPWLFHLDNVLLHMAACALVFAVAQRLGLSALGCALATLVFGVHPVVVEPVTWVTGRKDLLAAVFVLGAALVMLRPEADAPRARARQRGSEAALVLVAALAKPVALFFPLLALAWQRATLGRPWRDAARAAAPTALLAAPLFALAWTGQARIGAVDVARPVGVVLREAWYALGFHVGLVLLVQQPSAKHLVARPPPFEALVDLMPLAAAALAALALRRVDPARRRVVTAGLIFAGLAYLPSSSLLPLVRYLADTFVYLPMAGVAWCAGAVGEEIAHALAARGRRALSAGAIAAVALVTALGVFAFRRTFAWRSGVTLWTDVILRTPPSPNACRQLGNAHHEAGDPARALAQYRLCAKAFGPDLFETNIAVTLFVLGRRDEAREAFRAILAKRPGDPLALRYLGQLERPEAR
jgi:tetratricopeptide (TPR) repeat protein